MCSLAQDFRATEIWTEALAERASDPQAEKRDQLRSAFLRMRDNVAPLVEAAHRDCPGLTVHDVSHLDALWGTATRIVGAEYPINPAEAFVLGCAILLHDSGMAISAYDGGIAEIRSRPEWGDAI